MPSQSSRTARGEKGFRITLKESYQRRRGLSFRGAQTRVFRISVAPTSDGDRDTASPCAPNPSVALFVIRSFATSGF